MADAVAATTEVQFANTMNDLGESCLFAISKCANDFFSRARACAQNASSGSDSSALPRFPSRSTCVYVCRRHFFRFRNRAKTAGKKKQFGVTADEVRAKFAEIGDIKTFFDLVEKRAMAFITYVSVVCQTLASARSFLDDDEARATELTEHAIGRSTIRELP